MRRAVVLSLLCAAAGAGAARAGAQERLPALGAGRVAAQVVGGAAAIPVGYVAGGLATRTVARAFGASDQTASHAADVGAYAGTVAAVAGTVSLIGARGPGAGSFPAAVGGAAGGLLASKLLARALRGDDRRGTEPPCGARCLAASALVVALPSVGATVAYDITRRQR
jgi:hypothetical protein